MRAAKAEAMRRLVPRGDEVGDFIASRAKQLVDAAKHGEAPLQAVVADLEEAFGDSLRTLQARQYVGVLVASIMEGAGYEVASPRVRLRSSRIFKASATYRAVSPGSSDITLAQRIALSATAEECREMVEVLKRRFPAIVSGIARRA